MKQKQLVGFVKFESCGGCINSLLNHKEILALIELFEFHEFDHKKKYDLILIEGYPVSESQKLIFNSLKNNSENVILFGSCAIAPDILLNIKVKDLNSPPLYKLIGCPVNPDTLLNFFKSSLINFNPKYFEESVCKSCQENELKCIKLSGITCAGEKTLGPCEILCPKIKKGCVGCNTFLIRDELNE